MKKVLFYTFALIMVIAFMAGCSGNQTETPSSSVQPSSQPSSQPATEQPSETPAQTVTISIGYVNNPGEPVDLGCQKWAELLEERTNGAMKLVLYPSSQLGSMTDVYDMAMANDAVIAYGHNGFYADLGVPELNAMYAPYLLNSWDDFEKIANSDWAKEKLQELETIGLKVVSGNWHYGVRQTLTKIPINSINDLKGLKIRIPNSTAQITGYKCLGAVPTPMNLSEVYTALQQGTIDGLENPVDVLYNGKYQEIAKYLTMTHHMYNDASWSVGMGFWNSLTPEQQTALLETGKEAEEYFNSIAEKAADDALNAMKVEGVQVADIPSDLDTAAVTEAYFNSPEWADWPDDPNSVMDELLAIING